MQTLNAGKVLAIQLRFGTTFFLSATLKWSGGVPAWFIQQFQATWLSRSPGGLPAVFYFLAVLETVGVLGCGASIVRLEFLRPSKTILQCTLTFALFVFVVLAYGARLTGKFDVAAYNLMYFIGALLCLREISHEADANDPSKISAFVFRRKK